MPSAASPATCPRSCSAGRGARRSTRRSCGGPPRSGSATSSSTSGRRRRPTTSPTCPLRITGAAWRRTPPRRSGAASPPPAAPSTATSCGSWTTTTPRCRRAQWGRSVRAGDIGYLDEDGYVYVVDRKKDRIVSGGENVDSSEGEAALYRSPEVLECAVIGVPDDRWGEAVHAFVVKAREAAGDDEQVRARILGTAREFLAAYKVPKALLFVDA